jgi:hypothetical protein
MVTGFLITGRLLSILAVPSRVKRVAGGPLHGFHELWAIVMPVIAAGIAWR